MTLSLLTSREAVLAAMQEFDELGREGFLKKYAYGRAHSYFVEHDGRLNDSKAIAGVAVGFEHRDRGPLGSGEFTGGDVSVGSKLEELGFRMVVADSPEAPQLIGVHAVPSAWNSTLCRTALSSWGSGVTTFVDRDVSCRWCQIRLLAIEVANRHTAREEHRP